MDIPQGIERLLAEIGLQKQRSTVSYFLPALGLFAAGALVGGAVALWLAPKPGGELEPRRPDNNGEPHTHHKEKSHA